MRLAGTEAIKTKQATKKSFGFGGMWDVGQQGRCIYPIFKSEVTGEWELLTGACYGHQADFKALGLNSSFIPSKCVIDENSTVVGTPDLVYQFSKIAKSFVAGMKAKKIADAQKKFSMDATMLAQQIENINKEFDTKNNKDAIKAVIGKLDYAVCTEVIYIDMVDDGHGNRVPNPDRISIVNQPISAERAGILKGIANDPKFTQIPEGKDEWYIEVSYSWTCTSGKKTDAGRNHPTGETSEYKLANSQVAEVQQLWKNVISPLIDQLPRDSDLIRRRNMQYQEVSDAALLRAFKMYAINNAEYLNYVDDEQVDRLAKSADIISTLTIPIENPSLLAKLNENKQVANASEAITTGAPTLDDVEAIDRMADEFVEGMATE